MLIQDWMTKDILTVEEDASLMRVTRIMKEKHIRRLPVIARGQVTGIITDRDVKDASPSKTTSQDIHELYYFLSEMRVKDVMTPDPLFLYGDDSLEKAALVMLENTISGVVVKDRQGALIGLLSETDVLRGFIHATGIKDNTIQYVFNLPDQPGSVTEVTALLRDYDMRIISILTSFLDAPAGMKQVAIRVTGPEGQSPDALSSALAAKFTLVHKAQDELANLPRRAPKA